MTERKRFRSYEDFKNYLDNNGISLDDLKQDPFLSFQSAIPDDCRIVIKNEELNRPNEVLTRIFGKERYLIHSSVYFNFVNKYLVSNSIYERRMRRICLLCGGTLNGSDICISCGMQWR